MENYFSFHRITPLENMMIDLQEYGQKEVWENIEKFNNPFYRIKARKLMAEAWEIINKNNI
ncbi:MAG: hypothetical protein ACTSYZ_03430 [Candidatus Helarchaeota archaeon]